MLRATLIAAIAWLALAVPAQAETVAVQSGEHGDFTRLVLDFALPTTWQMVRTPEGYAVTVDQPGLEFDLSSVYRVITQDRLSTIWTDPATGALTLGIGCACHAFPFEMASDVLVIDLRDGPAPPASSFEYAADGELMPPLTPRAAKRPKTRPMPPVAETRQETVPSLADGPVYDWIAAAGAAAKPVPVTTQAVTTPEVPASEPAPHLDQAALQDALLRQISKGAARGTVEIAPAMRNHAAATEPAMTDTPAGHDPMVQIAVDGAGWVDPDATDREADRMTATGATCIPDSAVDVAAWGDARPVAVAMGSRTGAIYGDIPVTERLF